MASIEKIQAHLDETARRCLRLIVKGKLTESEAKRLAKFLFGCMNQKAELPRRVKRSGPGELDKVLKFAAVACQLLQEIETRLGGKSGSDG